MKKIIVLALLLTTTGCATGYQSGEFSITGGYYNTPVTSQIEKIGFHGNGYIEASTVKEYALFRSAEYANEKNKPYFLLYPTLIHAALEEKATSPIVGSVDNKPSAFCYVRLLDEYQDGALESKKILNKLKLTQKLQQNDEVDEI